MKSTVARNGIPYAGPMTRTIGNSFVAYIVVKAWSKDRKTAALSLVM